MSTLKENNLSKAQPRQSLFQMSVKWIELYILENKCKPGDKLPPERVMCDELGVSRTVLREALRAVESKGLISVYAGNGAYVSEPGYENFDTPIRGLISLGKISVADAVQARHFLEPGIAHVCALKATDNDIAKLEANIADMERDEEHGDKFIAADQQFHMNLALATKNPIIYVIAKTVVDSFLVLRSTVYESDGAPSKAIIRHRQILDAVKVHNAAEAYKAMEDHILDVEERQYIHLMRESLDSMSASHQP